MLNKFKDKIDNHIKSNKDTPFLAAFICALTPLLFYYSNNYWAVNSWSHLLYFTSLCLGTFFVIFSLVYYGFRASTKLKKYTSHVLFFLVVSILVTFLWHTFFVTITRRIVLFVLLTGVYFLISFKPREFYKKIIIVLIVFSSLSLFKVLILFYEDVKPEYWLQQPDAIENVKLQSQPNIYLIQPDGYVAKEVLEKAPYNFKSDLYDWLSANDFKVYDGFRSNYPASLTSNASLFGMKQHKFASMLLPEIEMANAREVITTSNPVISIFKSNNYRTYFIAQDEYFQQNRKQKAFDYFNIQKSDFPFFTKGDSDKRIVFSDLKIAMQQHNQLPKFFFIEKLLPHHVGFYNTEASIIIEAERYNERIDEVNVWLKNIINYITAEDKNAIIVILADHGGWVGLKSYNDLFSNTKPALITSTFSNLAAIRWNGHLVDDFDKDLKTNVNLFRVLFASLSKNAKYLEHLEDNSSYNLKLNSVGVKYVKQVIDTNGQIVE
jgi:hypothetical protein